VRSQQKLAGILIKIKLLCRFAVYVENNSKQNYYHLSGWMGDYGNIKIDLVCKENLKTDSSCIKIISSTKVSQGAAG
jgi:hypothetical protein